MRDLLINSRVRALRELLAKSNEELSRNTQEGSRAKEVKVQDRLDVPSANSGDGEEETGKTKKG